MKTKSLKIIDKAYLKYLTLINIFKRNNLINFGYFLYNFNFVFIIRYLKNSKTCS